VRLESAAMRKTLKALSCLEPMPYNRNKIFDAIRDHHGSLSQDQVDGINFLVDKFDTDTIWDNDAEIAYALATAAWETAWTFQPIDENGNTQYFERHYGSGNPHKAKELGNTHPGDGPKFHGRGYVQLTGCRNYAYATQRIMSVYPELNCPDLTQLPDAVKNPEIAYPVMALGMHQGWFTGHRLSNYFNADNIDFITARRIINGTDHAADIASIAEDIHASLSNTPSAETATPEPPSKPPTPDAAPIVAPVPPPVVAVPLTDSQPPAADNPVTVQKVAQAVGSKIMSGSLPSAGVLTTVLLTLKGALTNPFVICVIIVAGFALGAWIFNESKKRQMAIQNKLIDHGADQKSNTVRIVPPANTES
jgi:putative chitinase